MLLSKPLNPFLFCHRAPLIKASEPISSSSSSLISQAYQALSSLKLIKLSHLSSSSSSDLPHRLLIYHQALISTQHQSRRQPQPPASPSLAPVQPPASHATLTSLPHRCRPTHVLAVTDPSSHLTHLPTLPSQPLLLLAAHAVPAHFRLVLSFHF